MQLNMMRLTEAKECVAGKLGVSVLDLSDSTAMRTVREELDIGTVTAVPGVAKGLEAKARIAVCSTSPSTAWKIGRAHV
jgi:hypothetical protein